jgi:hypothetical protein
VATPQSQRLADLFGGLLGFGLGQRRGVAKQLLEQDVVDVDLFGVQPVRVTLRVDDVAQFVAVVDDVVMDRALGARSCVWTVYAGHVRSDRHGPPGARHEEGQDGSLLGTAQCERITVACNA